VVFADAKDGMLGMRVARQLEQPSNEPLVFTDIAGRATTVPKMDNTGVTGEYLSSEGKRGDAVWSTRGRWTLLSGIIGARSDHDRDDRPSEESRFPTYWHARGYGLFAANPLGQKAFTEGRETMNFTLEPGRRRRSATASSCSRRSRGRPGSSANTPRSSRSVESPVIHIGLIGAGNISGHARAGDCRHSRRRRGRGVRADARARRAARRPARRASPAIRSTRSSITRRSTWS
jgi:hypothetical protein